MAVERGVSFAQASRDLDVHVNVLRKWVRDFEDDPRRAFPGQRQMKPEQAEIERLRKEAAKLKAERDAFLQWYEISAARVLERLQMLCIDAEII